MAPSAPGVSFTTSELAVSGMHCQSCVLLIEEELIEHPAVAQVHVDLHGGRAEIEHDPSRLGVAEIAELITTLGYPAAPVTGSEPPG
jgi:copper chaperone CopZ